MEAYLWRYLVGEMERSKNIDEVNLFRNRPRYYLWHNYFCEGEKNWN